MEKIEKQLKNEVKEVRMTERERLFMRSRIESFISSHEAKTGVKSGSIKSPFHHFWNPLLVTLCSLVFIVASGGTVSISSANALPGDALYGFKVGVKEKVEGILISSPKEKLVWQQNRVAKRLDEVKQLAEAGELTPENAAIVEKAIDTHIAKIDADAQVLAKKDPEALVEAMNAIAPIIASHEKDLEILKIAEAEITATEEAEAQKTESEQTTTEKTSEPVVETATMSAFSITNTASETTKMVTPPTVKAESAKTTTLNKLISKIQQESISLDKITKPIVEGTQTTEVKSDSVKTPPAVNVENITQ